MPSVLPAQFVPCKCKNAPKIFLCNLGKRWMHNIGVCNLMISASSLEWTRFCHWLRNKKQYLENLENLGHDTISHQKIGDGIIERVEVCKNVYYNALQVKEKFVRIAVSSATTGIAK